MTNKELKIELRKKVKELEIQNKELIRICHTLTDNKVKSLIKTLIYFKEIGILNNEGLNYLENLKEDRYYKLKHQISFLKHMEEIKK